MRVLAVTPWFPTRSQQISGIFTLRDAELIAQDHEVTVLHLCRPAWVNDGVADEVASAALRVTRVPFAITQPRTYPGALRELRKQLHHTDMLHTMALPALLLARLTRPKIAWVHTEHFSTLVTPPKGALIRIVRKYLMRSYALPTRSVTVSNALATVIDRFRKIPSTVIPNQVRFPGSARTRPDLAPGQALRMVAVGGLVSRKGPLETVETLAKLVALGYDATLVWIGEGELLNSVQARAREIGVIKRCEWLGVQAPEDVSRQLLSADLFVLPAEAETFGVAMAEALAHGLPVVATGTGGHEEFLPREASRLVSERSSTAISHAIDELVHDGTRWGSAQIIRYAEERFSEERRRIEYAATYAAALQRS